MSYEFNPESQTFEFPNPYKVENIATITSGVLTFLTGNGLLFQVRDRITHNPDGRIFAVIGLSILLLLLGIGLFARAFTQLRYFFGRNRPMSLAPEVAHGQSGDSRIAAEYKETLRQNAIAFKEPAGAINGLLYSWLPHLIFAPHVIQESAQTQFFNFLSLLVTLISFLFCWLLFGQGAAHGWIGIIYGGFAFFQIIRPITSHVRPTTTGISETAHIGIGSLIILIILAILGPIVLGLMSSTLPALENVSINGVVFLGLICALAGSCVFGLALKSQLQAPPQTIGVTHILDTLTINAHPNKLIEEVDRILQSSWFSTIPNRKYTRREPEINGQQGQFTAEIFEEIQPRPQQNRVAENLHHALSTERFFWLTCLTILALGYFILGTFAAIFLAQKILDGVPVWTMITFTISEFAVGLFCYRTAHMLWGRFDFTSELIWIEIAGSFESANVKIGNPLTSNIQTTKNVINIENMSLRIWVAEIDTVIFSKDARRQLIGMRGLPALAQSIATRLKKFSEQSSMIVVPSSSQDLERAHKISVMNQAIEGINGKTTLASDAHSTIGMQQKLSATLMKPLHCTSCQAALGSGDIFCGACGTAVQSQVQATNP
jgi:hypothetical protein